MTTGTIRMIPNLNRAGIPSMDPNSSSSSREEAVRLAISKTSTSRSSSRERQRRRERATAVRMDMLMHHIHVCGLPTLFSCNILLFPHFLIIRVYEKGSGGHARRSL